MKRHILRHRILRNSFIHALLFALVGAAIPLSANPWPPKLDGIEGDPAVVYGTLENGLRWAYLPNAHPENQLSLRLLVEVGSFMEEDHELGIAHFLEHMAFNGTKHFPEAGQAIETFQRHGLAFGQHFNAYTGFLQTVYTVELPHLETALVDDAFRFLEDQAHGQVFDDAEIEKERGVILEEMRSRNSTHYRAAISNLGFLLGEGRFAKRSPIGTEESVKSLQKEDFEGFYRKWYTADRMILIGAGALSADDFEARVKAHFAGLEANPDPLPAPQDTIQPPSSTSVHLTDTPDAEHMLVQLANLVPMPKGPLTAEKVRENTLNFMATAFFAIHCNIQVAGGSSPYLQAIPGLQEEPGLFRLNQMTLMTQPSLTMETLQSMARDLSQLTREGFDDDDATRLKNVMLAQLQGQVQQAETRENAQLAQSMVNTFSTPGAVFQHPSQEHELLGKWFQDWDGKQIGESLRAALDPEHSAILLQGKLAQAGLDKDAVIAAYRGALAAGSEGKKEKEKLEWAYNDFGAPGEIVSKEFDPELKITRVEFANGARVNLREMSTRMNLISVNMRVGEGVNGIASKDRRMAIAAPVHLNFGGLGKHSLEEVQKLTMGKQFEIGEIKMGNLAIEINAGGLRNDFPMLLEWLAAMLSDPGFRGSSHALYQQVMNAAWKDAPTNPAEVIEMHVKPFILDNDWRLRHPSKAEMLGADVAASASWMNPQLREGYLEIGIAGDFKTEKLLPEIARTIGALPPRSKVAPSVNPEDAPKFTSTHRKEFRYASPDPKSALVVVYPVCSGVQWKKAAKVEALASVVEDALNRAIREEMGGSYGVICRAECGWDSDDPGQLFIQMECDPERIALFEEKTLEVLAGLAENGVTKDQHRRALKPLISQEKNADRDLGRWLGWVLSRSQGTPWFNERIKGRLGVLESTTKEHLTSLAREYLGQDAAYVFHIVGDKPAEN